jgi:hypothetical protein
MGSLFEPDPLGRGFQPLLTLSLGTHTDETRDESRELAGSLAVHRPMEGTRAKRAG